MLVTLIFTFEMAEIHIYMVTSPLIPPFLLPYLLNSMFSKLNLRCGDLPSGWCLSG